MSKGKIVLIVIAALIGLVVFAGIMGGESNTDSNPAEAKVEEKPETASVVDKVNKALKDMGDDYKSTLASTGVGGLQGDIKSVEAYGNDGVKVKVSTNFTDNGDGVDGGQTIAKKMLANLCIDVPELDSVYVSSTTSGLDSRSAYRSDIPACNQ